MPARPDIAENRRPGSIFQRNTRGNDRAESACVRRYPVRRYAWRSTRSRAPRVDLPAFATWRMEKGASRRRLRARRRRRGSGARAGGVGWTASRGDGGGKRGGDGGRDRGGDESARRVYLLCPYQRSRLDGGGEGRFVVRPRAGPSVVRPTRGIRAADFARDIDS